MGLLAIPMVGKLVLERVDEEPGGIRKDAPTFPGCEGACLQRGGEGTKDEVVARVAAYAIKGKRQLARLGNHRRRVAYQIERSRRPELSAPPAHPRAEGIGSALFGTPIVMNPKLLVPFVLAPLFGVTGAYILTMTGFMPYTTGISVPWTTPPILSGFLNVGWQGALWQAIELVASFFIYLPFARSVDQDYEYLAAEAESEAA